MRLIVILACILVIGGLAAYAFVRFTMFVGGANAQDERMTAAFVPDTSNRTSVTVRGWERPELDKMLSYLREAYEVPVSSPWIVTARSDDVFVISFPNDIFPRLLYFLVNYLQYPKEFDAKNRHIGVLGRIVLTTACGIPEDRLVGKNAEVYVPANDKDFDLVYLRTEDGEAYAIPFTDLIWKRAQEARRPQTIDGL